MLLCDVGLWLVLRELEVDWTVALPLALLPHAAVSFQLLSLQVKGDFLAAALSLWGMWCGLRYARHRATPWLVACALGFLGAFLTKFSALAGAALVCGWLWSRRARRAALPLGGALALLAGASLAAIYWASDERVLPAFRAAAAGGMHPAYTLGAPLWLLLAAVQGPVFLIPGAAAAGYPIRPGRGPGGGLGGARFPLPAP